MRLNEMTLIIGGDAGQGIESSGAGLCKALTRAGLHVFSVSDHRSRIRGGHNFYRIKTGSDPIHSWTEPVQLLIALTAESIERHLPKLIPGAAVIFDADFSLDSARMQNAEILPIPIPFKKIYEDAGGSAVMTNTAALGAFAGLTHFPLEIINSVITENFRKKGEKVIKQNLAVAGLAYDYVQSNFESNYEYRLAAVNAPVRMIINGNEALSLGAYAGGCRFVTAYPMTPATSIFQWFVSHAEKYGIVARQAEDEIAAACLAIGAAHNGARALVPTSGGGFSLMVEAVGLAAMSETPLVIVVAQRPGPATGLSTRTEQADLQFVINASQGEFAKIVLAPGSPVQCFEAGWRALNLAEKYQTPVFILTDAFLASSRRTLDKDEINLDAVKIERGRLLDNTAVDALTEPYYRYRITETGISPRVLPGHPNAIFQATSNEHNESGHISEDAKNRVAMHGKRLNKLKQALSEMRPPILHGPVTAELTFVCWGSLLAPLQEVISRLNQQKAKSANILQFTDIWPFPVEKVTPLLSVARKLIAVEGNATGQFARLIREQTGIEISAKILKFDGRPFSPEFILEKLKELR